MQNKLFYLAETKDYARFNFIETNRKISDKKVAALVKSIEKRGLQQPIIVNHKYEIVDGQHRFIALRRLGRVIYYVVSNAYRNEEDIVTLQTATRWTAKDYLYSNAAKGNLDSKNAIEFITYWQKNGAAKLTLITGLEVLLEGPGVTILSKLKSDTYRIDTTIAEIVLNCLVELNKYPSGCNVFSQKIARSLKALYYEKDGLNIEVIAAIAKNTYLNAYMNEGDQFKYMLDLYNKYERKTK
jgi:hypothetical protein